MPKINRQQDWKFTWEFIIQSIDNNYNSFNSKVMASGLDKVDSAVIMDAGRKLHGTRYENINEIMI